jgi:hypothetical protein
MIEDDLKSIETLQNNFKENYGTFFEMSMAEHNITVPKESDILDLKAIKRYLSTRNSKIDGNKEMTKIQFVPTCKNYKFIIGRGTQVDSKTGELARESWYCTAQQFSDDGKMLRQTTIQGGDESIGVFRGN